MAPNPLHILQLRVHDYGIIEDIHITPTDKPTILAGINGAGKSTTLNAIEAVLRGFKCAQPIREGQDSAKISVTLGNSATGETSYTVERKFTAKGGDALVVKDAKGAAVPKVSTFLSDLIGSGAAIDPTEIMLQRPGEKLETFAKRQAQTLMERLGLTGVLDGLDADIKTIFDKRAAKNSEVARLEGDVTRYGSFPASTPSEEVDVAALSRIITASRDASATHNTAHRGLEDAVKERGRRDAIITQLKDQLRHAETALAASIKDEEVRRDSTATLAASAEAARAQASDAQARLDNANAINANVRMKRDHAEAKAKLATVSREAHTMTGEIERLRADKLAAVAAAKIPVEGLEFSDQGLLYNGFPLIQESTGNMTRVCALLATAESSECRVMLLRNVTLLSQANREIIHAVAKERGYQVWEEVMCEAPPSDGLYIVDGAIAAVDGKEVA